MSKRAAKITEEERASLDTVREEVREAEKAIASESPYDECVCCHHRSVHSGKSAAKKCTSDVIGLGKCDCVSFRRKS